MNCPIVAIYKEWQTTATYLGDKCEAEWVILLVVGRGLLQSRLQLSRYDVMDLFLNDRIVRSDMLLLLLIIHTGLIKPSRAGIPLRLLRGPPVCRVCM